MIGRILANGLRPLVLIGLLIAPAHSGDDAAARSVWSTLDASWNARDAARFSQLFTGDASLRFLGSGPTLESREKIHQHFSEQFSRQAPDLRHRTLVRTGRAIAPNVLGVDGEVEVVRTAADESMPPVVLARFAIFAVMLESNDGYLIQSLRVFQLPAAVSAKKE